MKYLVLSFAMLLCAPAYAAEKAASKPAEKKPSAAAQLKALTEEINKTPDDFSLREKAVKLAAGMRPVPAVPQEARRHFVKGMTFQKEATAPSDYPLAIAAYNEALKLAPWWPDAIYNLAAAQESAGQLDESMKSFSLYLFSKPKDAEETQNRLYALEAKKEKAAKDKEEAEKKALDKMIAELPGEWVRDREDPVYHSKDHYTMVYREKNLFRLTFSRCSTGSPDGTAGCNLSGYEETISLAAIGRRVHGPWWGDLELKQNFTPWNCGFSKQQGNVSGTLSEDGSVLELEGNMDAFSLDSCSLNGKQAWKYRLRRAD